MEKNKNTNHICPYGLKKHNCPLEAISDMEMDDVINYVALMDKDERKKLISHHDDCLAKFKNIKHDLKSDDNLCLNFKKIIEKGIDLLNPFK